MPGQNTPAIAQLEAQYGEMWAQDIGMLPIDYPGATGLGIGAILKFKQHKDNPTQNPIGPRNTEIGDLTLLNQFSASDFNVSNGSLSDTPISDPNNSLTDATPLFAHPV